MNKLTIIAAAGVGAWVAYIKLAPVFEAMGNGSREGQPTPEGRARGVHKIYEEAA